MVSVLLIVIPLVSMVTLYLEPAVERYVLVPEVLVKVHEMVGTGFP